jgi:hypothetical protein
MERDLARLDGDQQELQAKCIQMNVESGVLCNSTAFVGASRKVYQVIFPYFQCCASPRRDNIPRVAMMDVISLQAFDGLWSNGKALLRKDLAMPDEIKMVAPGSRYQAWATILAIALLRREGREEERASRLVEKGIEWLERLGIDHEGAIARWIDAFIMSKASG